MDKEKLWDYRKSIEPVGETIVSTGDDITQLRASENSERQELNNLVDRVQTLADLQNVRLPELQNLEIQELEPLNVTLDDLLTAKDVHQKHSRFPKLSPEDVAVSSTAGLVAVAVDVLLVGTPEIVNRKQFDGSILTGAIRKMGEGPLKGFWECLQNICHVPFDTSAVAGGMYPQNHRLRSLGHDPFFGLFFAVFDIIMDTTTFIDDTGMLRILPNAKFSVSISEKTLAVFYFLGHIVSDMFTSRGIPVPGFFLTQFFTDGVRDSSIAKMAEGMYLDGFDLRHLGSMGVSVWINSLIIDTYLELTQEANREIAAPLAQKERAKLDASLKKEKMQFITNSITVGGNVVKFFMPPSSCNPCALNAPEWLAFLRSSIAMARAANRDFAAEDALLNRDEINANWDTLKQDTDYR
jgi:hypothetical protein